MLPLVCYLGLMLSHFQLLSSLPGLLSGGLFGVDWQGCFCRWYGGWGWVGEGNVFGCWSVFQLEVLCPSLELLDCGQKLSLFILDWLVCLLVSAYQRSGDVMQALQVSLCSSFFCLSCQVVQVASLICFMLLFTPL